MPLSDREQRILEEIERNLLLENPRLELQARRSTPLWDEVRRAKIGGALFAAGLVSLVGFFATRLVAVGVFAFGLMVGGIVLLSGSLKGLIDHVGPEASRRRQGLVRSFAQWAENLLRRYRRH